MYIFYCNWSLCQWTKFKPNRCTDFDAVFGWMVAYSTGSVWWKLVNFGQRSRSQWPEVCLCINEEKKFSKITVYMHIRHFVLLSRSRCRTLLSTFRYQKYPYRTINTPDSSKIKWLNCNKWSIFLNNITGDET